MRQASLTKRVNEFLTAEQAASVLHISVATLWRWRAAGELTTVRLLGRTVFDRTEVEALARKRATAAG